ncbi:hypothetical protein SDC9_103773 [bioreactor metagenome]|uniref:Uncharacterized protein n=1 Tax=bioreactor metagenome TaxID=1076179 RepID=A0A645AVY7_9ZZZZ
MYGCTRIVVCFGKDPVVLAGNKVNGYPNPGNENNRCGDTQERLEYFYGDVLFLPVGSADQCIKFFLKITAQFHCLMVLFIGKQRCIRQQVIGDVTEVEKFL